MEQKSVQMFESECGKAKVFVESDMAIGVFHDFLMYMKGLMIDRMVKVHAEERKIAEEQKIADAEKESSESCEACF